MSQTSTVGLLWPYCTVSTQCLHFVRRNCIIHCNDLI